MSGRLWAIVQAHIDQQPYPPSVRRVARHLGVAPQTVFNWRNRRGMPSRENLERIAGLTGRPYSEVLEAALVDSGYLPDTPPRP